MNDLDPRTPCSQADRKYTEWRKLCDHLLVSFALCEVFSLKLFSQDENLQFWYFDSAVLALA